MVLEDGNFIEDVALVDFNALPLLDKDSSQKLGDRVMGQLPELVSQFYVSNLYTQINYNNNIARVTPLEYNGFIKYLTNRKDGVKGYIVVNSVTGESSLSKLEEGMKYMPSAYFFENLYRKLRFTYPTLIFDTFSYCMSGYLGEIDILAMFTSPLLYYLFGHALAWMNYVTALSSKPQAAYTSLRADVFLQSCIRIYNSPEAVLIVFYLRHIQILNYS